jgi:hypothetical protein
MAIANKIAKRQLSNQMFHWNSIGAMLLRAAQKMCPTWHAERTV